MQIIFRENKIWKASDLIDIDLKLLNYLFFFTKCKKKKFRRKN